MTLKTLNHTLAKFRNLAILVIGDFFLDRYLIIDPDLAETSMRTGKPVFITLGPDGILVANNENLTHIPGIKIPPPIDIVGAGDSVSASVVSALCAGASLPEAAQLGVLASSITIQQIGTTGTASPEQIAKRFRETKTA